MNLQQLLKMRERVRDRDKSKVESVANVVKFTSLSQWKLLKEQVKSIF